MAFYLPLGLAAAGSSTGPTPSIACERAPARSAAAARRPLSPVRDIRSAISPVTIGAENDVPLQHAMPWNVRACPAYGGT